MKMISLPLVSALLITAVSAPAQSRFPTFKNIASVAASQAIRTDLQKVVADLPAGFTNIKGEVTSTSPQSVEYASTIIPAGAEAATITQYSAHNKPVYSWQALLLTTEDFDVAAKKYKDVFNQLKGTNVTFNANQSFYLQGQYDVPDDNKAFFTSMLHFATRDENVKKIKVEVAMQYEFPEWKVNIMVYERERADDERGNIFE